MCSLHSTKSSTRSSVSRPLKDTKQNVHIDSQSLSYFTAFFRPSVIQYKQKRRLPQNAALRSGLLFVCTKGLTYSDHIVPSVRKPNFMDTDGSHPNKKKKKNGEKGAVCPERRSRSNPSGPHKCRSPLPLGNVSSRILSNFSRAGCPAAAL